MKISAIIFDMDGLMIDTERLCMISWQKAGKEQGYDIGEEMLIKCIGRNQIDTKKIFHKHLGNDFPYEELRTLERKYTLDEMMCNGVPVKEGLIDVLEYCIDNKIPKVVATSTNRDQALKLLQKADIIKYFDTVVCGDEVEKGKPEPDIFLKACEKLSAKPENCIVLEDSQNGIVAAKKAGMIPIFIPDVIEENEIIKSHRQHKCTNLKEVIEIIRNC